MLAEVAGRIGRYEDAENLLRRALEAAPELCRCAFQSAIVLHRQHRSAERRPRWRCYWRISRDSPAYRNLHGAVQSRIGTDQDAVGEFERC